MNLPDHPYDIIVERASLSKSGNGQKLWQPQKVVIITDNHVGKLYAETVKLSFEAAGFEVAVFAFLEVKHLKT
jgi:3-dehydroquinate synthase